MRYRISLEILTVDTEKTDVDDLVDELVDDPLVQSITSSVTELEPAT